MNHTNLKQWQQSGQRLVAMTNRERFFRTVRFEPVDHPPINIGSGWWETEQRWLQEGMPNGVDLYEHFELEPFGRVNVSPETRIYPSFEEEIEGIGTTSSLLTTASYRTSPGPYSPP